MSLTAPRGHDVEYPEDDFDRQAGRPAGVSWTVIGLVSLGLIALAVVAAVLIERRHETIHGARAQIVLVFPGNTADDSRERLVKTQSEVLSSRSVLGPAAEENGLTATELDAKLSVDTALRSDVLTITTGDADPATAQRLTASVADRYLELSRDLVPESDEGEALVQRRIQEARRELTRVPEDERFAVRDRITRLQEWILELQVEALERPRARLLTRTYVLDKPLRPQPRRAAAAGLGIGLILAAGVAVVLRRLGGRRPA